MVRPLCRSPNHQDDMGLCTRPLWRHLQRDRWHVGFELLQLHSTQLVPFWPKADGNTVMERSAHHIHPILRRRTPPHLTWYLTWIITLQHQGRTCQSNLQPTAHWHHRLLHSFDAFGGSCWRREDQCSSTSSVNPRHQSKSKSPNNSNSHKNAVHFVYSVLPQKTIKSKQCSEQVTYDRKCQSYCLFQKRLNKSVWKINSCKL